MMSACRPLQLPRAPFLPAIEPGEPTSVASRSLRPLPSRLASRILETRMLEIAPASSSDCPWRLGRTLLDPVQAHIFQPSGVAPPKADALLPPIVRLLPQ